jgi:hypothetical protein
MAYSDSQIAEAVSTVHMNSKRQAKRNLVTDYANGDLNFIGDCAFAYSGDVGISNTEGTKTVLEFTNGPNMLKVKLSYFAGYDPLSTNNWYFYTYLNDVRISGMTSREPYHDGAGGPNTQHLIIPPFSKLRVGGVNGESATSIACSVIMIGKVYSGAEIIQGAI